MPTVISTNLGVYPPTRHVVTLAEASEVRDIGHRRNSGVVDSLTLEM